MLTQVSNRLSMFLAAVLSLLFAENSVIAQLIVI